MKNVTILLIVIFNFLCIAQATSGAASINKFIYGSHIQSSPNNDSTLYDKYWLIKEAGINFPYQTTRLSIPQINQKTNSGFLKEFDYFVSGNTTVRKNANHEKNIDHIYYYSNALYKKWECVDTLFPNPTEQKAGLFKGTRTQIDGDGNFFIQKDPTESSSAMFLKGPNYAQYKKYMYSSYLDTTNKAVEYTANFMLKAKNVDNPNAIACVIEVKVRDLDSNGKITTLETKTVLNSQLDSNVFKPITLYYNLEYFCADTVVTHNKSHFNENLKVFYEITWKNKCDLYLDFIEVYDEEIYKFYFKEHYPEMVDTIKLYNQRYLDQGFYSNLKFFATLDEPHGIDAFTPIGIIQGIIDSLRSPAYQIADLYSHAYPNYSGLTDGVSTFKLFNALAKPKKLSFWYFPYEVGVKDIDGLFHYVTTILPEAHAIQHGFFVAVQAWGQLTLSGQEFTYRVPTPAELSAQIMATLSFGAKGILIEPFYTHTGWQQGYGEYLVTGIVDMNYCKMPTYFKAQEIGARLNGKLGQTLYNLEYSGFTSGIIVKNTQEKLSTGYTEYVVINEPYLTPGVNSKCYSIVSLFNHKDYSNRKYFLHSNLVSSDTVVNYPVSIYSPFADNYKNLKLENIETGDTSIFTHCLEKIITLPVGEGQLYCVTPVVCYGGSMFVNEEIPEGKHEFLNEGRLVVKSGCTLTVRGTYSIHKSIIVEPGGRIEIIAPGKIIFRGEHIENFGEMLVRGSDNEPVILDFSASPESGITIESEFPVTIENAVIKGGTGLFFNDVKGLVTIKNSKFENCNTAISVNNLREALIVNNKFINCVSSVYSSNVSSIEVNKNEMISNLGSMPGIFLNSSFGNIRRNTIEGFSDGIVLGHSSVSLAENIIKNNYFHGLVLSKGAFVNMKLLPAGEFGALYTYGGFNKIYNNGFDPYLDGGEITIYEAEMELENGYNCIFDERSDPAMAENLIVDPSYSYSSTIIGDYNNWGNNNQFSMTDRFDYTNTTYGNTVNCVYPVFTQSNGIINTMGNGTVIDSLYPLNFAAITELLGIEALYNAAELEYLEGNFDTARTMYMNILDDYPDERASLKIYTRLFGLQSRIENEPYGYDALSQYYEGKLGSINNYFLQNCVNQLISLCSVSSGYLEAAIADFNAIIQNDPLSEAAIFAAIDKYTTELLAPVVGMGKGLVKINTGKYSKLVNELVMNKFGRKVETGKTVEVPTNYSLSQNYPNPFNPETIIKFSLLKPSKVKLSVFDILGREIKVLVNEHKDAGVYNINFNARGLSSGVYIYRIDTEYFKDSKKMIILK